MGKCCSVAQRRQVAGIFALNKTVSVHEDYAGGGYILDARTHKVYGVNHSAIAIAECLQEAPRSVLEVTDCVMAYLASGCREQVAADVKDFIDALVRSRLVTCRAPREWPN